MSDQLVIDTLDFVRNAGSLRGRVCPCDLERLQDYLADKAGELVYSIEGLFDHQDRPMLRIAVSGTVNLSCQRCLEQLEHALELESELLLARNEDELCRYDENVTVDAIMASTALDILTLIEDEIILSLPNSPRHQDVACLTTSKLEIYRAVTDEHPFAALATLKQSH